MIGYGVPQLKKVHKYLDGSEDCPDGWEGTTFNICSGYILACLKHTFLQEYLTKRVSLTTFWYLVKGMIPQRVFSILLSLSCSVREGLLQLKSVRAIFRVDFEFFRHLSNTF